jgi:hypothetical protein
MNVLNIAVYQNTVHIGSAQQVSVPLAAFAKRPVPPVVICMSQVLKCSTRHHELA